MTAAIGTVQTLNELLGEKTAVRKPMTAVRKKNRSHPTNPSGLFSPDEYDPLLVE
jgi:hypothetical protein